MELKAEQSMNEARIEVLDELNEDVSQVTANSTKNGRQEAEVDGRQEAEVKGRQEANVNGRQEGKVNRAQEAQGDETQASLLASGGTQAHAAEGGTQAALCGLVDALTNQVKQNSLPSMEPDIFKGDVSQF